MTLRMDVAVGESIDIDRGRVIVTVEQKSGRAARLAFDAPPEVSIQRAAPKVGLSGNGQRKVSPVT